MQQTARVSDRTPFFTIAAAGEPGTFIEIADTTHIVTSPTERATEDYITRRSG